MDRRINKILLVEDEVLIALELIDFLEDKGHNVTHVTSLTEALREASRPGWRAAIVDFRLFEECATPVLDLLRANHVPFLIYSGDSTDEVQLSPKERVIDKPTSCEIIFNVLEGLADEPRP